MLAGFVTGLLLATQGAPRRLARQLFSVSDGFLSPVFFVWLGASLDLRSVGGSPKMLALAGLLAVATVGIHAAARLVGQPLPAGPARGCATRCSGRRGRHRYQERTAASGGGRRHPGRRAGEHRRHQPRGRRRPTRGSQSRDSDSGPRSAVSQPGSADDRDGLKRRRPTSRSGLGNGCLHLTTPAPLARSRQTLRSEAVARQPSRRPEWHHGDQTLEQFGPADQRKQANEPAPAPRRSRAMHRVPPVRLELTLNGI